MEVVEEEEESEVAVVAEVFAGSAADDHTSGSLLRAEGLARVSCFRTSPPQAALLLRKAAADLEQQPTQTSPDLPLR